MRDPEMPSPEESRPGRHSNGVVMPPLRGSTPRDLNMAKMEYLWTALDKLESRMAANDRRLAKLRPPQRPDPEPPYSQRRRYAQPTYRQPQHQQSDRYLPSPPYPPDRHRPHHLHQTRYQLPEHYQPFDYGLPHMYSGFPRRQFRQPQHEPARQPSCWDPPGSRVPMGSLAYEESAPIYYPNYDCDSDGYDEDFDVGYSRRPYHQPHSVQPRHPPYFARDSYVQTQSSDPYSHQRTTYSKGHPWHKDRPLLPRSTSCCRLTTHLRQAAACLEQPAAEQLPLLQRPPSCRHPSSGTIDEETCFMDHKIDYLSDNEKGVGHGSITATGTLPAPPHAAESRCFSHLHLHHDPYISSTLAVAAILPPQAAISPSCSPDRINTLSSAPLPAAPPPQAAISQPCSPDTINTVVQHKGKSSTPKGEIKSILSNKGIIGRTASGNQPMITGFGCLIDTRYGG